MEQRLSRALRALGGLAARIQLPGELNLRGAVLSKLKDPDVWRAAAPWIGVGLVVVLISSFTWARAGAGGSDNAGFHVKCTAPDCGRHFVIPRSQVQDYPRDPSGRGLKCKSCGRFTGGRAIHCEKCGEWFVGGSRESRGGCPRCNPAPAPAQHHP